MLRVEGFISVVDEKNMTAKVIFPQHGEVESDWLPLLNRANYFNYDKDQYVACLMDDSLEDGWIIGCLESEEVNFQEKGVDLYYRKFSDDTLIKYDRKNHKLSIELKGTGEISIDEKLIIKVAGGYEIEGDVKIKGKLEVEQDISSKMNIKAGANVQDNTGSLMQLRMAHKTHNHPSPPAPTNPVITQPPITTV